MAAGQTRMGIGKKKKWHLIKSHIERRALNNRDNGKGERQRERQKRIINSKMPSGHSIKPNEKLKDSCASPAWFH